MKKILAALILLSILGLFIPKPLDEVLNIVNAQYLYYIPYAEEFTNCESTYIGGGAEVSCGYQFKNELKKQLKSIEAVSIVINNCQISDLQQYLKKLNAKVVLVQELDEIYCLYAFSPLINTKITVDKQIINVQLVFCNNSIIIGSPLIIGSY